MSPRVLGIMGSGAFIVGLILAVISGWFWPDNGRMAATVVVLGLIVGLLNITGRQVIAFLVASVALVLIGQGNVFQPLNNFVKDLGTALDSVVNEVALFAAPAALLNAVRVAVALGRPGKSI